MVPGSMHLISKLSDCCAVSRMLGNWETDPLGILSVPNTHSTKAHLVVGGSCLGFTETQRMGGKSMGVYSMLLQCQRNAYQKNQPSPQVSRSPRTKDPFPSAAKTYWMWAARLSISWVLPFAPLRPLGLRRTWTWFLVSRSVAIVIPESARSSQSNRDRPITELTFHRI